ncbi:response regulator [Paraburkholderia edwinii]|jgi:FixJ family two-component response regulator|uniref:Response regulator n=1 Tax=Paraburkholderia edwinii TaxID=2861782 RepID=A0ABX8UVI1_9BURK|nr:response regulator [Paraburkholderia edwinii]QYD72866.1 response regulator [Paraburkholderia edwinii]
MRTCNEDATSFCGILGLGELPEQRVTGTQPIVYVVDDDASMRATLGSLLLSVGYRVETFDSSAAFLAFKRPDVTSCLVLDIRLRGESGLAFQRDCGRFDLRMPILFVTGHGDVAMSVQAMKAGAVDFLAKPFRDQDMLDAIHDALERDSQRRREEERLRPLRHCYTRLSSREREVMHLVITGLLNKQIAGALDVSEDCVKLHRSQVMKKMNARSVPDLVRKAKDLGINPRC